MPIYEYACELCSHKFEKLQRITDEPLKTCPSCGKDNLNKLVSAAGFRLAGTGWYETDFKKDKQKNLVGSEKTSNRNDKTANPTQQHKSCSQDSTSSKGSNSSNGAGGNNSNGNSSNRGSNTAPQNCKDSSTCVAKSSSDTKTAQTK